MGGGWRVLVVWRSVLVVAIVVAVVVNGTPVSRYTFAPAAAAAVTRGAATGVLRERLAHRPAPAVRTVVPGHRGSKARDLAALLDDDEAVLGELHHFLARYPELTPLVSRVLTRPIDRSDWSGEAHASPHFSLTVRRSAASAFDDDSAAWAIRGPY
ncbi:MAG: hypothetical protein QM658_13765 [Gordonia sp. (in: high G+C Gram-positive bacteria)]